MSGIPVNYNPIKIGPIRKEILNIHLKIDTIGLTKKELKKIKKTLSYITDDNKLANNDSADIYYTLDVEYFGAVDKKLTHILSLLDNTKIFEVNTKELKHGKSIIQELIAKLEQIEQKYKDKNVI